MKQPVPIAMATMAATMAAMALWLSQPRSAAHLAQLRSAGQQLKTQEAEQPGSIPLIRVRISSVVTGPVKIRIDGPYRVSPLGQWHVLAQGSRLPPADVRSRNGSIEIGDQEFPAGWLKLEVIESGTLWVDGHRYRGSLHLMAEPDERITAINVVELEAYLASVLPSEMPDHFPPACRRAQAIAARTYALFHMKTARHDLGFDLDDSTHSQRYLGMEYMEYGDAGQRLAVESASSRELVEQTRGMILTYHDRLFCSYFFSVCGGHTANGPAVFGKAAPPLVGIPCRWCEGAPRACWEMSFDLAGVTARLEDHLEPVGKHLGSIREIHVNDPGSGLVPTVQIEGELGEHEMPTTKFRRSALRPGTPSAFFAAEIRGEKLLLRGRGWGHGVGLCQWGAKAYAEQGRSCAEILALYYPGSRLAVVK